MSERARGASQRHRDHGGAVAGLDQAGEVAGGEEAREAGAELDGREAGAGRRMDAGDGFAGGDGGAEIEEGLERPASSAKVKQSADGMSSQRVGVVAGRPFRMPAWIRRLRTPRLAIAAVSARAVPPPPSSVVTKVLPKDSAVVSSMPTSSISSICIEKGAAKAAAAARARGFLGLVGEDVGGGEGEKVEGAAAGVEVEDQVGAGEERAGDVVGDLLGDGAGRRAREAAVEVAAVDRAGAGGGAEGGEVERGDDDDRAGELGGIEGAGEVEERDRALVLVAVGAAGRGAPWGRGRRG